MKLFMIAGMLAITAIACKKADIPVPQVSSVNVINAAMDLGAVKTNYVGPQLIYNNYVDSVIYGASKVFTIPSGDRWIRLVRSRDSSKIVEGTFSLDAGSIYSMYVTGQYPDLDTMYRKESFSFFSDSSLAIRIVNLSPNSTPLNVTLSGTPAVNEFTGIGYKQQTEFKKYAAGPSVTNAFFTIQVRDDTGVVLTSYAFTAANLAAARFRQVTLVVRGLVSGTGAEALGITFVANY